MAVSRYDQKAKVAAYPAQVVPVDSVGPVIAAVMLAMTSRLRFRFNLDKFANSLAFLLDVGKIRDLTKLKAVKLLYLADQYHLLRYGRPITGARYIAMDYGPVPEEPYQLLGRVISPDEVEEDPTRQRLLKQVKVYRGPWGRPYKYPILLLRSKPDLEVFSDSDLEALNATVREFGGRPGRELVDLTHLHRAYLLANAGREEGSSVFLPYEYFFEDAPDDLRKVQELAEDEQEDRDFGEALQRAGRNALMKRKATA